MDRVACEILGHKYKKNSPYLSDGVNIMHLGKCIRCGYDVYQRGKQTKAVKFKKI